MMNFSYRNVHTCNMCSVYKQKYLQIKELKVCMLHWHCIVKANLSSKLKNKIMYICMTNNFHSSCFHQILLYLSVLLGHLIICLPQNSSLYGRILTATFTHIS